MRLDYFNLGMEQARMLNKALRENPKPVYKFGTMTKKKKTPQPGAKPQLTPKTKEQELSLLQWTKAVENILILSYGFNPGAADSYTSAMDCPDYYDNGYSPMEAVETEAEHWNY